MTSVCDYAICASPIGQNLVTPLRVVARDDGKRAFCREWIPHALCQRKTGTLDTVARWHY